MPTQLRPSSILFFFLIVVSGCAARAPESSAPKARNVILLIGDGMGFSELALARLASVGPGGKLHMDHPPYLTAMTTHALDKVVTDSAASGVAMASGEKTNNHSIGVDPDGKPLSTVLEEAKASGKSTGLVSTSRITDATPAVFAAHLNVPREAIGARWENDVPASYLKTGVDVMLGGGLRHWIPKSTSGSARADESDHLAAASKSGYRVARSRDELTAIEATSTTKVLGLFTPSYMSFEIDRDAKREPSLAEMTAKSLEILGRNPNGFFLMVEAGLIDVAAHAWDGATLVREVIALDAAVKVAFDYAQRRNDTLVLVTADHAAGGLSIPEPINLKTLAAAKSSIAAMIRRLKPGMANLREILRDQAGIDISDAEIESIRNPKGAHVGGVTHKALQSVIGRGGWEIAAMIAHRAGLNWNSSDIHGRSEKTYGHEGSPVPLYGYGPGAEQVRGLLDNTDVARIIRKAYGMN
ncbi:MAG: alkaline phosphatase [Deltaproteobacteria bacterium]|nr:alkaline phosphatase [Deltaproteobacteria bacterium]